MPAEIYITDIDYRRINECIAAKHSPREAENLHLLRLELTRARRVKQAKIPPDVVTMRSRFRLKDLGNPQSFEYTLVYPDEADFLSGKLSVLSPIGTAVLGQKTGNVIEWKVPAGTRYFVVDEILFQPEAALEFDL